MLKRLTTLALTVAVVFSVGNAQSKATKVNKKENAVVASDNTQQQTSTFFLDYMNAKLNKTRNVPANGDTLLYSDYDYQANQVIRPLIDPVDFDNDGTLNPVGTIMIRKVGGTYRSQELFYGDLTAYANSMAFDTVANKYSYGYGMVVTPKAGPLKGKALVVAHGNSQTWMTQLDLSSFVASAPVKWGSNFPSINYANDGTIWSYHGGNAKFYKSTDKGTTFVLADSLNHYFKYASFPSEQSLVGSADGKYLSTFGTYSLWASGNTGIGYAVKDSADYVGWLHSEDAGATWKAEKIGYAGYYGEIGNRVGATYYKNFGQLNGVVDNSGITHMATNGYGEGLAMNNVDTINTFTILYWNSSVKKWNSVSDRKVETDTNYTTTQRPGNGIGQSYPVVSVSDDGKYVVVLYQTHEYLSTPGASALNVYPGDGGAKNTAVYYTDLFAAFSQDGGKTFGAPVKVAGKQKVSECYPSAATRLEVKGGKVTVHFVYYEDKIPGTAILSTAQNGVTMSPWIYKTYSFTTTGVENKNSVVNKFELEQNYPNPFNPTTQISYSLEKSGMVTLKVYNVLGKEVATLVNNKTEAAGKHTINFDGSNLTSGMYIYTLNSGNQVVSKKMMLVK